MGCEMSEVKFMLKRNWKFDQMKKAVGMIQHKNKGARSGISEKSCQILTRKISVDSGDK
jgi:hypothetical protein